VLGRVFGAVRVHVPAMAMRLAASALWHARVQPTPPGWVDLGLAAPLMTTDRAARDLGWAPTVDAASALAEIVEGMAARASEPTPAMAGD